MLPYRLVFTASDVFASRFFRVEPYKLIFSLTERCNSKCRTCNIWRVKPEKELTTKEIEQFLTKNQFSWINLTGGEIFLRNDIGDVFRIVLKRQKRLGIINLTTNASMPERIYNTLKILKGFKGLKVVTLSIDAYGKKHDELRGLAGNYKNLIRTYKLLSRIKGLRLFFGTTLSVYNQDYVTEIYKRLRMDLDGIRFNQMHLNIAENSDNYYHKQNVTPENYEKVIRFYLEHYSMSNVLDRHFLKKMLFYLKKGKYPYKRCSALKDSIFVNAQGHVYPCISYNKKLGSLRDEEFDLRRILTKYRNVNLLKECPKCWTACEAYCSIFREFPL